MNRNDETYKAYIEILREELQPAMGCTEPISLAYGAAVAKKTLNALPDEVELHLSGSILKNIKSVIVPHTDGMKGAFAAAAAGIVAGDADAQLQVLSEVTDQEIGTIKSYMKQTEFHLHGLVSDEVFDFEILLRKGNESSYVRIARNHTNIVKIMRNNEIVFEADLPEKCEEVKTDRSILNMQDIFAFATIGEIEDYKDILDQQIECNMRIAKEGIENPWGARIGRILLKHGERVEQKAKAYAAAGSDARMSGCEMPVVINSGSGNQGITVSVPILVYAEEYGCPMDRVYRALALANLISIHEKAPIGTLSAYCGATTAGAAAGAGICFLKGGDYEAVIHTIVNAIVIASGMVCDGAKPSCAAKIAEAVDAGILGYEMYLENQQFYRGDGLVGDGIEPTLQNIARLGKVGMKQTNDEIISMMLKEGGSVK